MKVEGIPAKLEVKHEHNVNTHNVIDIQIGYRTTENVINIIKAAGAVAITVYTFQKAVDLAQRGGFELVMRSVWHK